MTWIASDDSDGAIGEGVFDAVELINTIATDKDAATDIKEDVFKFIATELHDERYFDGDTGYDLFGTFETLAGQLGKNAGLLDFIDLKLRKLEDTYTRDFFLDKKISFLENEGKAEEIEILISENLHIKEIRQKQVNKAIDNKDFAAAKALIADGIKIAQSRNHKGIIRDWEKELLRIAEIENDLVTIRLFCKRFAFDYMFNKQYYNQWKNTFNADEWGNIIEEEIKTKIQEATDYHKKNKWGSLNSELLSKLTPFYIEEQYWPRLLSLVKNETGIDRLLQYHCYLSPYYPAELIEIYLPALEAYADHINDRSGYAALVNKIEMIQTDIPIGKDQIIALVKKLRIKHARRPAMIDELSKL
jgi:hypothetical protein